MCNYTFVKVVRIYLNIPQIKIIVISFRTTSNPSNNFLNIRYVVATTYY